MLDGRSLSMHVDIRCEDLNVFDGWRELQFWMRERMFVVISSRDEERGSVASARFKERATHISTSVTHKAEMQ
jgi:hypothetical protein